MKTTSIRLLPLVAALGLSAGAAMAQTGVIDTARSALSMDYQLARADRKFIQEAAESGMFEVEIARLAESKASSADVKDFASTLAQDHGKANDELVQLANSKKVELPAAPPRGKRKDVEKMAKLTGNEFDQRFVREVGIKDHEKAIKKFEKASANAKDADLKAWVDKTLPKLREHLAVAQKMPSVKKAGS